MKRRFLVYWYVDTDPRMQGTSCTSCSRLLSTSGIKKYVQFFSWLDGLVSIPVHTCLTTHLACLLLVSRGACPPRGLCPCTASALSGVSSLVLIKHGIWSAIGSVGSHLVCSVVPLTLPPSMSAFVAASVLSTYDCIVLVSACSVLVCMYVCMYVCT